ncbi:MAG TPA: NAD(P)-dependent oxidoreductase [Gemmatimonadales bacterium]|jgi:3-hydroxyisobutyrate dehydrogenase|nr:NAD(P)-dependent oxidoreductase [Gemmatimonadales bacterium]
MKSIHRIGFVGLGRMGRPMAGHLTRAGFDLVLHDVRAEAVSEFVAEHGGRAAVGLADVGKDADAVITMLPTSAHVRDVILGANGDGGVADALAAGAVVIDTGASDPVQTRALGAALRERGIHLIDAPVAGGVVFACDGSLDIMVGGEPDVIERVRPVLDAFGRKVHACGGLGNAHAMKSLNNYVNAASIVVLVEALTIGRRLGLDLELMLESIAAATTGRNHPLDKKILPQVVTRRFAHGAALGLMTKDVRIALDSAVASGAWAPMAERCAALWKEAEQILGFDADQTEVARLWEQRTGVVLARDS